MKGFIWKFLMVMFMSNYCLGQTDTVFWFAAPEVLNSVYQGQNEDRPIVLNISSYSETAVVTVSQPAAGGMPVQTITLAPNATGSIDLTNWIDNIECKPANSILNNGLKISSSSKISVYYEVNSNAANPSNPDLFSLKGKNALGNDFWISSQTALSNRSGSFSSFNIVATDNNTIVTVTPSNDIVGHLANTTYYITLNKGQTYAAVATSELGSKHLQGSHVTSTKPIAITLGDDELYGGGIYSGTCYDLAGDQTVPTDIIGNEYIAIRGSLNPPYDKVYLMASSNGTAILQDGLPIATLNAGQSFEASLSNPSSYFKGSKPFYAYQLSGIGCEVGSAMLPKLTCTGSSNISFKLTSSQELHVSVLVKNGGQNSFLVNGTSGVIASANFFPVPGTANNWYAAYMQIYYPVGTLIRITNPTHFFHLGLLQGDGGIGTGFGYFSDFAQVEAIAKSNDTLICLGSTLQLFTDSISGVNYNWVGPNGFFSPKSDASVTNISPINSGNYVLSASLTGCPLTTDTLKVKVKPTFKDTFTQSICQGDSLWGYTTSGTYTDHLYTIYGCDSFVTIHLTVLPSYNISFNTTLCSNQLPFAWRGKTIRQAGTYYDSLKNIYSCDSVATLVLSVVDQPLRPFPEQNTVCKGGVITLDAGVYPYIQWSNGSHARYFDVKEAGRYSVTIGNDCDTLTFTCHVSSIACNVPNAFSPNGDGFNDKWVINSLAKYSHCTVSVYSRYGQPVFESIGYSVPWNGTYKGKSVPVGVYYYVISVDNNQKALSGWVSVLR